MAAKSDKPPAWDELPALLSVRDASRVLGISQHSCYEAVHQKKIPAVQIGRRLVIPKWKLMETLGVPTIPAPPNQPATVQRPASATTDWLPLPPLSRVAVDQFDPAFAAEIACAAEMPDGSLWVMKQDGTQVTITTGGTEVSQALVRLTVRRATSPRATRR